MVDCLIRFGLGEHRRYALGGGHVRFTTVTLQGAWHIRERKSTRPQKNGFLTIDQPIFTVSKKPTTVQYSVVRGLTLDTHITLF